MTSGRRGGFNARVGRGVTRMSRCWSSPVRVSNRRIGAGRVEEYQCPASGTQSLLLIEEDLESGAVAEGEPGEIDGDDLP